MQTQALYLYASSPETQSKKRKNLRLESNTSLCEMEIGRGFTNHPAACNVPAQCPQPLNSLLIILLCIMNLLIGQSNQLHLLSIKWMDWKTNFTLHTQCGRVCANCMPKHKCTAQSCTCAKDQESWKPCCAYQKHLLEQCQVSEPQTSNQTWILQ